MEFLTAGAPPIFACPNVRLMRLPVEALGGDWCDFLATWSIRGPLSNVLGEAMEVAAGICSGGGERGEALFAVSKTKTDSGVEPLHLNVNPTARARWLLDYVIPHESWLRTRIGKSGANAEVDDVVQDSYLRLMQAQRVEHVLCPRAYAAQAARSVIMQRARRNAIIQFEQPGPDAFDVAGEEPLQDRAAEARAQLAIIVASIETLTPRARQVLILRRLKGLSLRDTAKELRISESAVEKHLRSATRRLRAAVAD